MEKSLIRTIARLLVFIGAINWGLIGISYFAATNLNIVSMATSMFPPLEAVVYILVGLSGVYLILPGKKPKCTIKKSHFIRNGFFV